MAARRGDRLVVWTLDPREVNESWTAISLAGRRRAAQSRALDQTEGEIILRHDLTEQKVRGQIPAGHRSRAEMRRLKAELRKQLFLKLEASVARSLRIPGR